MSSILESVLEQSGACGDSSTAIWDDGDWLPHCERASVVTIVLAWLSSVVDGLLEMGANVLGCVTEWHESCCICTMVSMWFSTLCEYASAISAQISANMPEFGVDTCCCQWVLAYLCTLVLVFAFFEASKWVRRRLPHAEEITIDLRGMSTKDSLNKVDQIVDAWTKTGSRTACVAKCHEDSELRDSIMTHLEASGGDRVRVQRLLGEHGSVRFWLARPTTIF